MGVLQTAEHSLVCLYHGDLCQPLSRHLCLPSPNPFLKGLGILPEAEAPSANPGDGISDVDVPRVDQNGSSLKFSVTWADGGGDGGFEDTSPLVDIWLAAQQSDPPAWVEVAVQLVRVRT